MTPDTNVTTLHVEVEQLAALDQCRYNFDELNAPSYAEYRGILETEGNLPVADWNARVEPRIVELELAWGRRTIAEGAQTTEAGSISGHVGKAMSLFSELYFAINQAARRGVPEAVELLAPVERIRPTAENFRHVAPSLTAAIELLSPLPNLAVVGLRANFIQRAHDLRAKLHVDRSDLINAQSGISAHAGDLRRVLVELANMMEELNDARELAMVRVGRELPGFDLRLVRAAVAPRRPVAAPNVPPTPTTGL